MDNKFITYLKENNKKMKYSYVEDGIYSSIFISKYGEYSTFAKAKKELTKYTRQRFKEFKNGLAELPKSADDINAPPGSYYTVYYDGMFTTIEASNSSSDHKKFSDAKKEAKLFFKQKIADWNDAWKRATALKPEDIEEEY